MSAVIELKGKMAEFMKEMQASGKWSLFGVYTDGKNIKVHRTDNGFPDEKLDIMLTEIKKQQMLSFPDKIVPPSFVRVSKQE